MDLVLANKWLHTLESKRFWTRTLCLLTFCVIIVYDEYRLSVKGLAYAVPAMILSGITKAINRYEDVNTMSQTKNMINFATILLSAIIAAGTTCLLESDGSHTTSSGAFMPVVSVNLALTATAIISGGSMLSKTQICITETQSQTESVYKRACDHLSTVAFVGMTTALSLLAHSPPFVSIFQIIAFGGAATCAADSCWFSDMNEGYREVVELRHLSTPSIPCSESYESHLPGAYRSSSDEDYEMDARHYSQVIRRRPRNTSRTVERSLIALSVLAWFLTTVCAVTPYVFPKTGFYHHKPSLDMNYTPANQLDVVISMYKESPSSIRDIMTELMKIPAVAQRSPRLLVYTKDGTADVDIISNVTGAVEVFKLPNEGREGATYLHHIVNRWNDLANHTFFMQADVHNPRELYPRIRDYYSPSTGMLSLGFSGNTCDCENCGDRWGWSDTSGIISRVYEEVYNESCSARPILLSYKGQFVASAARLKGNHRALYDNLLTLTVNSTSWTHQEDYRQGRPDSMNAPLFGYTLERLWSVLLQCSDERIAARCPTLLSGTRRWGLQSDCQCLDSDP